VAPLVVATIVRLSRDNVFLESDSTHDQPGWRNDTTHLVERPPGLKGRICGYGLVAPASANSSL